MTPPKVIAFDLFGTVFDMANVPREEIRAYLDHVTQPGWAPLVLPESWERLQAFADSAEGIKRLREKFKVGTLSNGPYRTVVNLSENAGIYWDFVTALEMRKVYKPKPKAYLEVCYQHEVKAAEVLMVTANPTFAHYDYGDIEMARSLGMQAILIRGDGGGPATIIELAERLGC